MRVIAGKCRSLNLKSVPGMNTRPTQDRTKETLFNVLQPYIADSRMLDLFSGSGAIGIEALSRGAEHCVFVEKDRQALSCIRENLRFTKLEADAEVLGMDVMAALNILENGEAFDCIFMDPPYNHGLERAVLERLAGSHLMNEDAVIVVEASLQTDFSYLEELGFYIRKEKKYKTNMHLFLGCRQE